MKHLTFISLLLSNFAFGQIYKKEEKYDTLLFFNEFFVAPNSSITSFEGYGKFGFDFGAKRIFKVQKQTNFVYGIEFSFIQFYLNKYKPYEPSKSGTFINTSVSTISISNSFGWRFHFGNAKRIFIELGLFIDYRAERHIKGTYDPYDAVAYSFNEKKNGSGFLLGSNFGIGTNFFFEKFELSIKPDIKFNLSPILNQNPYYLQNAAYSRILFSFRFLK